MHYIKVQISHSETSIDLLSVAQKIFRYQVDHFIIWHVHNVIAMTVQFAKNLFEINKNEMKITIEKKIDIFFTIILL